MSDKPSYLGLLNAIAVAEARAHEYLTAWAECTPSADVRGVLLTVAAREGEHGMSFAKRINELGYEVRCTDDSNLQKSLALVTWKRLSRSRWTFAMTDAAATEAWRLSPSSCDSNVA